MALVRSARRSGSGVREGRTSEEKKETRGKHTRNVVVHACLKTAFTIANHYEVPVSHDVRCRLLCHVLACAVKAMIGVLSNFCSASNARISSVASIPPMNGIDTSIYTRQHTS